MKTFLKIVALLALAATVAAAGAILYAVMNLTPVIESVSCSEETLSAAEMETVLHDVISDRFAGVRYTDKLPQMEDLKVMRMDIRLKNNGLLPAEWISVSLDPADDGSVVALLPDDRSWVLMPRSEGDLSVRVLCRRDALNEAPGLTITSHILGHAYKSEK